MPHTPAAAFLPAVAMAGGVLALVIWAQLLARDGQGNVAVLFAPWSSAAARWTAVADSGGWVLGQRWGGLVFDVKSDGPDFARRLDGQGVGAVVIPSAFAGCSGAASPRF